MTAQSLQNSSKRLVSRPRQYKFLCPISSYCQIRRSMVTLDLSSRPQLTRWSSLKKIMGEKANATWSQCLWWCLQSRELVLRAQSQGCARFILIQGLVMFVTRWLVFHFTNRIKEMINLIPCISAMLKLSLSSPSLLTKGLFRYFSCVWNDCVHAWVGGCDDGAGGTVSMCSG